MFLLRFLSAFLHVLGLAGKPAGVVSELACARLLLATVVIYTVKSALSTASGAYFWLRTVLAESLCSLWFAKEHNLSYCGCFSGFLGPAEVKSGDDPTLHVRAGGSGRRIRCHRKAPAQPLFRRKTDKPNMVEECCEEAFHTPQA